MTDHLMGPFVRRFLLEDLVADRNLSPNTQKSYRDTIRLLLSYVAEHHKTDPVRITVEQIDAAVVRSFLAHLENERGSHPTSFFFFVVAAAAAVAASSRPTSTSSRVNRT